MNDKSLNQNQNMSEYKSVKPSPETLWLIYRINEACSHAQKHLMDEYTRIIESESGSFRKQIMDLREENARLREENANLHERIKLLNDTLYTNSHPEDDPYRTGGDSCG